MKEQGHHTLSPSRYFYRFRQKKSHSRAWANDNPENPVCLKDPCLANPFLAPVYEPDPLRFW